MDINYFKIYLSGRRRRRVIDWNVYTYYYVYHIRVGLFSGTRLYFFPKFIVGKGRKSRARAPVSLALHTLPKDFVNGEDMQTRLIRYGV